MCCNHSGTRSGCRARLSCACCVCFVCVYVCVMIQVCVYVYVCMFVRVSSVLNFTVWSSLTPTPVNLNQLGLEREQLSFSFTSPTLDA